jgi:hypothetical protein
MNPAGSGTVAGDGGNAPITSGTPTVDAGASTGSSGASTDASLGANGLLTDSGTASDGPLCLPAMPPVPNTPVVCTSKFTWTGGNGQAMRPGDPCLFCHTGRFVAAGTVYPTAHEVIDCNGVNGSTGVTVVITDNKGTSFTLTPNSVGNFTYNGALALPYRAKVVMGGKTRSMMTPQVDGNCNVCHTQSGANCAPGRILLP